MLAEPAAVFPGTSSSAALGLLEALESTVEPDCRLDWPECRVVARRLASGRLGGDFHAAVRYEEGLIALALGAVDSDTPRAELAKLGLAALIRRTQSHDASPRWLLDASSQQLREPGDTGSPEAFSGSAFYAVVDRTQQRFRYYTFGGCHAFGVTPTGGLLTLGASTLPAATATPTAPQERMLPLTNLRRVVVGSQGVITAKSANGEAFGTARLRAVVARTHRLPLETQVDAILPAVTHHAGVDRVLADDATVLAADFADELTLFLDRFAYSHPDLWRRSKDNPIESSVFLG